MRPDATRERNERIAAAAARHHFDLEALVTFLCECSDSRCEELLRLTLPAYRGARGGGDYLVAPGHQVDDARIVRIKDACWLYRAEVA
jgi:hypothetical protein